MRVTHAVGDRCIVHVEANRQRVDQQSQGLIDASLHAPEQHSAEHDASIGIERAASAQHARPCEMTQAREAHADVSRLRAQTRVQRGGQRHARFGDGRSVMVNVGEAEGQRGLADIGEHVAEERFMRFLTRTEPRLCDEIAERLGRAERMAAPVEDRANFRMHHFQRRMIADQVMPVQLHEPALAIGFMRDRDMQQRRTGKVEALRARIEMAREMVDHGPPRGIGLDLVDLHGRMTQHHLRGRGDAFVNESGAQNVMPFDDLLQCVEPRIETRAGVEREARRLQIRIAFGRQHVVKQNAFLQRCERINVLHIADAARHASDDTIDIRLRQFDQRQHVWRDRFAIRSDGIGRNDDVGFRRGVIDRVGECAEHGRGEKIAHAGLQTDAPHPLDERHREQRMPAEREEVVMPADSFDAEQLGPQLRERGFGLISRRFEGAQRKGIGLRIGQRAPIELAAGRERQRIERDERGGRHVVRQARAQMLAQFACVDAELVGGGDIGDQLLILRAWRARTRDDHGIAHGRMTRDL
ncbi:hypothetical protein AWB74_04547 [Caballeronia arvi]|uniref:Uncharacterized protein n=1 Tax=Caballeronia arvi TaxID=1777135 RepID=A0A158JYB9_9BURK|nr:hypothetical protein AWB74_04547 [Caballeronia arvi]